MNDGDGAGRGRTADGDQQAGPTAAVDDGSAAAPTALDRAAWFSLRVLVVLGAVVAGLLVAGRLRIVLVPVAVALIVAAPLRPIAQRLERYVGRSGAAVVAVLGLVAVIVGTLGLAGNAVANDFDELQTAVSEGVDDVESWLADRGIDAQQLESARERVRERLPSLITGAASQAVVVGEVLAGLLLAVILSIFVLRDADAAVEALARRSPPRRAARIRLGAAASWKALRRYLLGAAILGAVEAVVIGSTVAIVGSPLAVPVAAFTFLAAFVPIVGAVVAGVVAVFAALVGGGPTAALVVAIVAVVVQQLDGDLLAPLVYGKATQLHPAAVLVAVTTGTALAGLAGAILAVPTVTVAVAIRRSTKDDAVDEQLNGQVGDVRDAEREVAG